MLNSNGDFTVLSWDKTRGFLLHMIHPTPHFSSHVHIGKMIGKMWIGIEFIPLTFRIVNTIEGGRVNMRLLDNNSDKALNDVLILLTKNEAEYFRNALGHLLSDDEHGHYHIMDMETYEREVNIALYDEANMENNSFFIPRVIDLIKNDK